MRRVVLDLELCDLPRWRRGVRRREWVAGLLNGVCASLQFARRYAPGKLGRLLGKTGQGIEYFAASPAADLTARRPQNPGGQPKDRLAFWTLSEHPRSFSGRVCNTNHRVQPPAPYQNGGCTPP